MNEREARQRYETAVALHRQGKLAEAERNYAALRRSFPDHPGVLHGLGSIWLSGRRLEEALAVLGRAAALAPSDGAIAGELARVLLQLGRFEDAAAAFRRALDRRPGDAGLLVGLGEALNVLGHDNDAKAAFDQAIVRDPNRAAAYYGLGLIAAQRGRRSAARASFERAIALAPQRAAYHRALAELEPFQDGDARLAGLACLEASDDALPDGDKAELHFALGKAFDDLKRFDEAFAHFAHANAIHRGLVDYHEAAVAAQFAAIRDGFTPALLRQRRGHGFESELPVFVVGMPRSGTSLIEQILAAHPLVHGAGELQHIGNLIAAGMAGADYPSSIASLSDDRLAAFGQAYVARLRQRAPRAARIVDKLPANFRHLGLIQLALPGARIVHVRRDAMDTCWSCYTKLFPPGLNFAYDLGELGRYHRMYDALMAHWRAAFPAGAMLEISYETLLGDLEGEARRMIAFLGLDWDARCLRFHEVERSVRTLSAAQVRQPLFRNSVGRWNPYAGHLQPLRDALG